MTKNSVINKVLKNFSQTIKDAAKIVQQNIIYGARLGNVKLKELKYEQKKLEKLIEIGRTTYSLYKKGLITDKKLQDLCKQLSMLESTVKTYHTIATEYKKKLKL